MNLLSGLLDLLFPPPCPFCGKAGGGKAGAACSGCKEADFWVPPERRVFSGKHFTRCVCIGWYQDELRNAVRQFKFRNHPEFAKAYGRAMAEEVRRFLPGAYDCITWMPVSEKRLKERGYDQARLLAEAMGEVLNVPVLPLLKKTRDNPAQSSLTDGRKRASNVAGAYTVPDPSAVQGRRVLLVDDIFTTGSTLEEGARTLRTAGCEQVVCAVLCRTPWRRSAAKEN